MAKFYTYGVLLAIDSQVQIFSEKRAYGALKLKLHFEFPLHTVKYEILTQMSL